MLNVECELVQHSRFNIEHSSSPSRRHISEQVVASSEQEYPRVRVSCSLLAESCSLRSVPPRRHAFALADRQLRHQFDQPASRFVGVGEGMAEHFDVLAILAGGDGEAVRGLFGAGGGSAAPRTVEQLEAEEVGPFSGLEAL